MVSPDAGETARPRMLTLGKPIDRTDRLIALDGMRANPLIAEYSEDGGTTWLPATIYIGATIDEWRTCALDVWNRGVLQGILPAGDQPCVWSYFFDLELPLDKVLLRLTVAGRHEVVLEEWVDLTDASQMLVIDYRNVAEIAGGPLTGPWSLKQEGPKKRAVPSIFGQVQVTPYDSHYPTGYVENPDAPPLVLHPNLKGWHRIYIGMESVNSVQFSLSGTETLVPVPREEDERLMREYLVAEADLTGQVISLALGGTRVWRDTYVRYIRFVPMTDEERARLQQMQVLAETKGRLFAGYVEQVTAGYYLGETITLQQHTRNEMRLRRLRGCTEVYVHVIRVGCSAWYHSDVVDRYLPHGEEVEQKDPAQLKWAEWMKQGDPMAEAVEEAKKVGLRVFADIGMNVSYLGAERFHYRAMTGRFAEDHPEYACPGNKTFLDYRQAPVRDYVVAIARELMTQYDVDGLHLDFARFAYKEAFDTESLVDTVQRIHQYRREAEHRWGHPITMAVRIPSYRYHTWEQYVGDYPEFVEALKIWAQNGWIDRVMACCMEPPKLLDLSLERYHDAIAGTDVELWGDLYGGFENMPRSYFLDVARKWCQEGLDGGFFFYDVGRPIEFGQINWQLRLIDMPDVIVEP